MAADGVLEGDKHGGQYGAFGTNPFGRSPIKVNDIGMRVTSIDWMLTPAGLQRTLELIGWPAYPIAPGRDQRLALEKAGHRKIIMGDPHAPSDYYLWDADAASLTHSFGGIATLIIRNGPEGARYLLENAADPGIQALQRTQQWDLTNPDYIRQAAAAALAAQQGTPAPVTPAPVISPPATNGGSQAAPIATPATPTPQTGGGQPTAPGSAAPQDRWIIDGISNFPLPAWVQAARQTTQPATPAAPIYQPEPAEPGITGWIEENPLTAAAIAAAGFLAIRELYK